VPNYSSTTPWRHMGEWRYSSTILALGTRWRWVVSFMLLLLYPQGKSSWNPLDRRLDGPQNRSGCCEEKKISCPWQELNPGHPTHSPMLYQLSYLGSSPVCLKIHTSAPISLSWGWFKKYPHSCSCLQKVQDSMMTAGSTEHCDMMCWYAARHDLGSSE
jgi:hypothetical protein